MKLFRLLSGLSLGLLAAGSLAGCIVEPTYSVVPEISYNADKSGLQRVNDKRGTRDSLTLTVNYQDGDGDLGLEASDTLANPRKYIHRFAHNFFLNPFVRGATGTSGPYIQLADAGRGLYRVVAYDQAFVHATSAADSRSLPIKGTLTLGYSFFQGTNFPLPGETVEFHVSIADRALHESNVVVVPVTFPR